MINGSLDVYCGECVGADAVWVVGCYSLAVLVRGPPCRFLVFEDGMSLWHGGMGSTNYNVGSLSLRMVCLVVCGSIATSLYEALSVG